LRATWLVVMTREFPDELLSAYLDDELTPAERARVEERLAASEDDRRLLAELKRLRADLSRLPTVMVSSDFADRVVQAAVAEAQKPVWQTADTSLPPAATRHPPRRWTIRAATLGIAAVAAALLLVVQPWRSRDGGDPSVAVDPGKALQPEGLAVATTPEEFSKLLSLVAPGAQEALVLRLRVSKDAPLSEAINAALVKANIKALAADAQSSAGTWQEAYRRQFDATAGKETIEAAQALLIEAPLAQLNGVLTELAAAVNNPLALSAEGKLAVAQAKDNTAEGENAPPQVFAQRLNASLFRLQKQVAEAATALVNPPPAAIQPDQFVRVLILVETE
jgi:hypothetical protein